MYLIIGLGNPGKEYENTRHNVGFNAIDNIAEDFKINVNKKKFDSIYGLGRLGNNKVMLVKPQTFMNVSGKAVYEFKKFYKVPNNRIIIIYDDIDIEKGEIKLKKQGTAGSHNGMKSIVQNLNSTKFARIRIGVGKPIDNEELSSYILKKFSKKDKDIIEEVLENIPDIIKKIIEKDYDYVMNEYNNKDLTK